jgi:signal transduction histidine kinase
MSPEEPRQNSSDLTEEQLRARVAELEKQLNDTAALVADVRHEVSNPLTGVLGQAQLLLREELPDKVRLRVQKIEELALRVNDVTGKLREVAKPSKPPAE